ncbi:MAG: PQQ-binding-like beta-propeller repeat protein [Planctomycetota bacterium]
MKVPRVGCALMLGMIGALGTLATGGCQRGEPMSEPVQAPGPTISPLGQAGYRLRWRREAPTDGQPIRDIEFLDGRGLALVDATNEVHLLEHDTGRTRWRVQIGSPLLRLAGIGAAEGGLVAVMPTELSLLSYTDGELLERHSLQILARSKPAIINNLAVVGSRSGRVAAIDINRGFDRWAYDLDGEVKMPPVQVGDSFAFVSAGGQVVVLGPDGSSRGRRTDLFGPPGAPPATDGTLLYVASRGQSLWALETEVGGGVAWRVRTQFPLTERPAAIGGRVLASIPGRGFVSFDTGTGEEVWSDPDLQGEVLGTFRNRLMLWDASDRGGSLRLLDQNSGRVVETIELPGVAELYVEGVDDGNLFVSYVDGGFERYSVRQ